MKFPRRELTSDTVDSVTPGASMIIGEQLAQLQLTEVTDIFPNSAGEINYLVVDNVASDVRILGFLNDSDATAVADTVGLLQIIDSAVAQPETESLPILAQLLPGSAGESKLVTFDDGVGGSTMTAIRPRKHWIQRCNLLRSGAVLNG